MKIIRCDRCDVDGDLFPRQLTINSLYLATPVVEPDHRVLHLCGYCTAEFKKFLVTT